VYEEGLLSRWCHKKSLLCLSQKRLFNVTATLKMLWSPKASRRVQKQQDKFIDDGYRTRERSSQTLDRRPGIGHYDSQGGRPPKLISSARRRATIQRVRCELGQDQVSQRRLCQVLGQSRSTQRYRVKIKDDEPAIIEHMHELVRRHPRRVYRFVHAMLCRAGFHVNKKRVYRLWKKEGFKVPVKQCKKRSLGVSANGIMQRRPAHQRCLVLGFHSRSRRERQALEVADH